MDTETERRRTVQHEERQRLVQSDLEEANIRKIEAEWQAKQQASK